VSNEQRQSSTIRYVYRFTFPDKPPKDFVVNLEYDTLALVREERVSYPDWTRLRYHQCANCPLQEAEHERCPVAANLVDLVEFFGDLVSYEETDVMVEAENRQYTRYAPLQKTVASLLGLIMATSGCPILDQLRPMVETHLPFMSAEESTYRMISSFFLGRHFARRAGQPADPERDVDDLLFSIELISEVHRDFCARLRSIGISDATLNALLVLSSLSSLTSLAIEHRKLDRLQKIFEMSNRMLESRPRVTPNTLPGVTPEGTVRTSSLALLISEPGSKTPRRLEFDKEEIVLGKDPVCEVVLEDPKVSRRHARISISRGMIFLQDLKSTNGTYLNGHLIRGERSIASSDVIRIVDCMIRVVNMAVIDPGPTSVDIRRPLLGAVPDAGAPRRDTAITVTAMHRRPRPTLATAGRMTSLAAEARLYVVLAALAAAALLVALWL